MAKELVKEIMKVTIRSISRKKNRKMITMVRVDPIEVMNNTHLLMSSHPIIGKNNNNSAGHYARRENLIEQIT